MDRDGGGGEDVQRPCGEAIAGKGTPAQEWNRAASQGRRPLSGAPEHQLTPASPGFRVGVLDRASWGPHLHDLGSRASRPGLGAFFLMKNLEKHVKHDNLKNNSTCTSDNEEMAFGNRRKITSTIHTRLRQWPFTLSLLKVKVKSLSRVRLFVHGL